MTKTLGWKHGIAGKVSFVMFWYPFPKEHTILHRYTWKQGTCLIRRPATARFFLVVFLSADLVLVCAIGLF